MIVQVYVLRPMVRLRFLGGEEWETNEWSMQEFLEGTGRGYAPWKFLIFKVFQMVFLATEHRTDCSTKQKILMF